MKEFVARENIKRFQAQLDSCTDQKQREVLIQLLESERRKLDAIRTFRQTPVRAKASPVEPDGPTGNS